MVSPARLRPFRTTAFKLSALYLVVFGLFAAFLIGTIARSTTEILQSQMRRAVDAEMKALAEQYASGGIARLARSIELRSRRPGASLYLLTDTAGAKIAGNVESVPTRVLNKFDAAPQVVPYQRLEGDNAGAPNAALVRVAELAGGGRILVGRDISEADEIATVVRQALIWTVALMAGLGLISWLFVSRRVLKRIDSIADSSRRIMEGDLSRRLEVTGTGDEFDRLAESLNAMLARIERLMVGLKQVSDNIAHDLKTPLTRMRNRIESILTQGGDDAEHRAMLQVTIDEADQLIRTFNALLMIARVEAGSSEVEFGIFDAAEVACDVFELYEPLAEQAGVSLKVQAAGPVLVRANRELISQALANLVDNAIKYSDECTAQPQAVIAVGQDGGAVTLSVTDNGAGIGEGDRTRVTERFVRLEESRSKPGAG
ncbi:MAG TPA: HAMP domain-containing protein, partial [Propylenella sp.]|nr:HAMP domain-containing protein [Propylenella sp.]